MKNIFYLILFIATLYATFAHAQDTTLWWQDSYDIIVSKRFLGVVGVKDPTSFRIPKGVKYVTVIIAMPDTSKAHNLNFASYPIEPQPIDDTTKIDAREATFVGNWVNTITTAPGWYKKTIAFSNVTGATMTYNFTGTNIQLWAERKAPPHGNGTVTIIQGTTTVKSSAVYFNAGPDTNKPLAFGLPVLIYDSGVLPRGDYTMTLRVGTGYNLADFFVVKN